MHSAWKGRGHVHRQTHTRHWRRLSGAAPVCSWQRSRAKKAKGKGVVQGPVLVSTSDASRTAENLSLNKFGIPTSASARHLLATPQTRFLCASVPPSLPPACATAPLVALFSPPSPLPGRSRIIGIPPVARNYLGAAVALSPTPPRLASPWRQSLPIPPPRPRGTPAALLRASYRPFPTASLARLPPRDPSPPTSLRPLPRPKPTLSRIRHPKRIQKSALLRLSRPH